VLWEEDGGHRMVRQGGGNPKLRATLEERGLGYVLAVACSAEVATGAGRFRADGLAGRLPKRAWQKLSAGPGAKGHRYYDWAVIDLTEPTPGHRQLLIRRNRTTGELAYYRSHSTGPAPLRTLVRTAGSRWRVEETFQAGKGLAGLDEHQVRRYPSWSRWVTLAMLAHAFLAVVRADEHGWLECGHSGGVGLEADASALFTRPSAIGDVLHGVGESAGPLSDLNGCHRPDVTLSLFGKGRAGPARRRCRTTNGVSGTVVDARVWTGGMNRC
jgi:hypothetical protein